MIIQSNLNTKTEEYKSNYEYNISLLNELQQNIHKAHQGGGEQYQKRLQELGKMPVRERILKLIDADSEFLELSVLAGLNLYEEHIPCAGIITGIGKVCDTLCMIIANDPTVKGGTYFPITLKKHLRAQEIAENNYLPCIYLVDSGGAFLPMQSEVFPDKEHFGRIFYNQAKMSAKGIPQIACVHGMCTAGGAYIPAMSDQTIIVQNSGTIYLAGPPLVKAATGEDVNSQELGGAEVHTSISGVADYLAQNDEHAISIIKLIISNLGSSTFTNNINIKTWPSRPPKYDPQEILGIIPRNTKKLFDVKEIIARIVDNSEILEFKQNYATSIVCGFAHIEGMPIGIIANNGVLFSESALKATHFIEICSQENIPLLFLQNISGFIVGKKYEHQGIAKDGAKMVHAVANSSVPKITIIIGESHGAGNYGMCGRAFSPDYLFMWPNAKISVMGAEQAANVLITIKEQQLLRQNIKMKEEEKLQIQTSILEKYKKESSAYYSTARLWDDGIIDPTQTRKIISMALASTLNRKNQSTKFGIYRM